MVISPTAVGQAAIEATSAEAVAVKSSNEQADLTSGVAVVKVESKKKLVLEFHYSRGLKKRQP